MATSTNEIKFMHNLHTEKLSISEARRDLTKLVHTLESEPSKVFELDRHDNPLALLLSFEEYSPIIEAFKEGNLVSLLATFVVNKWLGSENIPPHIYKPQLQELKSMNASQLLILSQIDPSTPIKDILKSGDLNESLVSRLVKRASIAKTISEAEKSQLFDVAEHLSQT